MCDSLGHETEKAKVTRIENVASLEPLVGCEESQESLGEDHIFVFLSTRHFTVQLRLIYRTSILLILNEITVKTMASPGTSFMFHYAIRCCLRCIHGRLDENSLEFARTC